jgi:hypothetical protein
VAAFLGVAAFLVLAITAVLGALSHLVFLDRLGSWLGSWDDCGTNSVAQHGSLWTSIVSHLVECSSSGGDDSAVGESECTDGETEGGHHGSLLLSNESLVSVHL